MPARMLLRFINVIMLALISYSSLAQVSIFEVSRGTISFHSDAPRELIFSTSKELRGAVNIQQKTFAFRVNIASFKGFNNDLQEEHFNESYLESTFFPDATFSGKIIEDIDLTKDGEYFLRAKGKLKIHGLEQERIIKAHVMIKDNRIVVRSDFIVPLSDHNIKVPRVVYDKLSPDIKVKIFATLLPKRVK